MGTRQVYADIPLIEGTTSPQSRVEEIMTHEAECIRQDATLEDALTVLCRRRFNALPVVCNRRVVGIVVWLELVWSRVCRQTEVEVYATFQIRRLDCETA